MSFLKSDLKVNADPHTLEEKGFSPVCIHMCFSKKEFVENADPHTSQENDFF